MGLWGGDGGLIQRPGFVGRGGVYVLPQRSYMCYGSLRQQVIYPDVEGEGEALDTSRDREIARLLKELGLENTLTEFGARPRHRVVV